MFSVTDPRINARLVILLFAPAQWLLTWCVRYADLLPIPTSLRAAVGGVIAVTALLGTWTVQGKIFRSMTGIRVLADDNYFFAIIMIEALGSLGVVFLVALQLRKDSRKQSNV